MNTTMISAYSKHYGVTCEALHRLGNHSPWSKVTRIGVFSFFIGDNNDRMMFYNIDYKKKNQLILVFL